MQNIDSLGVEKALELFPDQIKSAWNKVFLADISKVSVKSVVISGMGGSSNAAKILQGIYEDEIKIPLIVFNDYGLPEWVDKDTLVIANSYSGNTEETLSAIESASKSGSQLFGITTGGKMGEMITSGQIKGIIIDPANTNPTGFPKTGLGVSLGALAGSLCKLGIIDLSFDTLGSSLLELVEIRKTWNTKETASWLNGSLPILLGARPFIGSLNAGRNAMCEISRNFTQFYDFPELNHVLIEAMKKPDIAAKSKYLFFLSKFNHPRVLKRYKITGRLLKEQGLDIESYLLKGTSKLTQALELSHYCSWIGYHLAILQNTDPGPEPWISKLKEELNRSDS